MLQLSSTQKQPSQPHPTVSLGDLSGQETDGVPQITMNQLYKTIEKSYNALRKNQEKIISQLKTFDGYQRQLPLPEADRLEMDGSSPVDYAECVSVVSIFCLRNFKTYEFSIDSTPKIRYSHLS